MNLSSTKYTTFRFVHLLVLVLALVFAGCEDSGSGSSTTTSSSSTISLSPTTGTTAGGTTVTITGSGFTNATRVTFGGTSATSVTVNSSTHLTVVTPSGSAGTVAVSVITQEVTTTISDGFTYFTPALPTITSITDDTGGDNIGSSSGGETVTITGTNFDPSSAVATIGGEALTNQTVSSDFTTITGTTPANSAGLYDVAVTNSAGSTSLTNGYRYVDPPTITSVTSATFGANGPLSGGTTVTIEGTNFADGLTTITVGGTALANLNVVNTTTITGETPSTTASGSVDVVVTLQGESDTLSNGFTYHDPPTITSVTPDEGTSLGNTSVSIGGTNFVDGFTTVTVDGNDLNNISVDSATTVTGTTPSGSSGAKDVVVTAPGGTATLTGGFTYNLVPTFTSITPDGGSVLGATSVTIVGTNFVVGGTTVTIDGTNLNNLSVDSTTQITGTTPAGTSGSKVVVITTSGGTVTTAGAFTYYESPTITEVSPKNGSSASGTVVTITGTNFVSGDTSVTIGGVALSSLAVVGTTQINGTISADTAGAKDVIVTTPAGSVTLTNGFTHHDPATVTNISPSSGATSGGGSITITGTNFVDGETTVTIGGNSLGNLTVVSSVKITGETPVGTAGARDVEVTTPGSTSAVTVTGGFTYHDAPTITTISPTVGPVGGSTTITITGTNFVSGETTVTVGGNTSTSVTFNSTTEIEVSTPTGTAGAADVVVTTPGGSATFSSGFTYYDPPTITSVSPTQDVTSGGSSITITGTNFVDGNTAVTIDGTSINNLTFVDETSITGTVPSGSDGEVNVTVTTPGGSAVLNSGFTYFGSPTVTSVSPSVGDLNGGISIAVNGTNFIDGNTTVTVGGLALTDVTIVNTTQLTGTLPANSAGEKDVQVTTAAGSATLSGGYTYADTPTITSLSSSSGSAQGGESITISGTNFIDGFTSVTVGGSSLVNLSVTNTTTITGETPAGSSGAQDVVATTPGGTATLTDGYTYDSQPTISSVTPNFGTLSGGTSITITGTNYSAGTTSVTIGGNSLTLTQVSSNQILGTTPSASSAGDVDVIVTVSSVSVTLTDGFSYLDTPTITSFGPYTEGPLRGGTPIRIVGTNFSDGNTTVTINGNSLTNLQVVSTTEIVGFVPPSSSSGEFDIAVSTPAGSVNFGPSSSDTGFTYREWTEVSAVRIQDITYAPSDNTRVYAVGNARRGILVSSDSGDTWSVSTNSNLTDYTIQAVAVDPTDADTVYVGTSNGVFKSTDGAATFSLSSTNLGNLDIRALGIHPTTNTTIYAASAGGGVFKSTDGAGFWTEQNGTSPNVLSNLTVQCLSVDPSNGDMVYIGTTDGGVFKTTDGGTNWSAGGSLSDGTNTFVDVLAIVVAPSSTNIIHVSANGGGYFLSSDSGSSFGQINSGLTTDQYHLRSLAVHPTDPDYVWACNGTSVFRKTNFANSFTEITPSGTSAIRQDFRAVRVNPGNADQVVVGGHVGVFRNTSATSSTTFTEETTSNILVNMTQVVIDPTDASKIYVATDGNGVFRSIDGGTTWQQKTDGLSGTTLNVQSIAVDPNTTTTIYIGTDDGVYRTTDYDSVSWTSVSTGITSGRNVLHLLVNSSDSNILYAATNNSEVYRSTDGASSWSLINNGLSGGNINVIQFDPTDSNVLYAGTGTGGVFRTGDASDISNNAWTTLNNGLGTNLTINDLYVDPSNNQILYIAADAGGVFISGNAGSSWSQQNGSSTNVLAGNIQTIGVITSATRIVAGSDDGTALFLTSNSGSTWTGRDDGFPTTTVTTIAIDTSTTGTAYAGTSGAGVFKITDADQ